MHTARVALVTGAGNLKGIGRGVVKRLSEAGIDVVVNYLSEDDDHEQVVEEVRSLGQRALAVRADLTSKDEVRSMFREIENAFGRLDILVNNAGRCVWEKAVDITPTGMNQIIDVNVRGTMECSREAARLMIANGRGGRIVNICSLQSKRPTPSMSVYSASKAGIDHLTQSLALALARHRITVNQVWPGFVDTDINGSKPELNTSDAREKFLETIPAGRCATPKDLGEAVAYFCRDDADVVTGATLKVDGGAFIRCLQ
jgi:NAD(P)-dependent dehydrogenase (short-subunit alcohol dehydrogenase family)